MEQTGQAEQTPPQPTDSKGVRPRRDRWVKVGFVVMTLAVVTVVYLKQRGGTGLEDWGTDLNAALVQAKAGDRPVLVFFDGKALSEEARRMVANTIPKNAQAVEKGRFIRVLVRLDSSLQNELAKHYKITAMPTMLVLGPDGIEKNRRQGFIGEADFRNGFLDCTKVVPAPQ